MDRPGAVVCGRVGSSFTSEATDSLRRKTGDSQDGEGESWMEVNEGQTSTCQNILNGAMKPCCATARQPQRTVQCYKLHSAEEEAPAKSETGGVVKGILQRGT